MRSSSHFYSLGLLSGSSILLEITLTRLFSTIFYPPYVFAIISLAGLGIGLGAALAAWKSPWRALARLPGYIGLGGYSALSLLLAMVWLSSKGWPDILPGLAPLPYFFIGLALATFFSAAPLDSPRLYRADLWGAGVGAILAIPVLNLLGGVNAVLLSGVIFGVAAWLVGRPAQQPDLLGNLGFSRQALSLLLVGLASIGLLTNIWPGLRWLEIDMAHLSAAKPITESLSRGGRIIHTRWDSFARTDLVAPGPGKPYELYIDGAAGSIMPPAGALSLLRADIGFFPFATAQPAQVLVIGPGGGLDVWFALNGRAQSITAVEVNPASVKIVDQFAAYHGDLYGRPEVRVLVDEGRSVLRREGRAYDLIYLSQVVTLAAGRSGYALTENTIYTVEAFSDYLSHLQPGGQIGLKLYDELSLTRATVTAITALSRLRGLSEAEAAAHLAVFLDPDAEPPVPLLLVQDQPFSRDEALAYAGVATQVGFVPLFAPGAVDGSTPGEILRAEQSVAGLIANSSANIFATTDDRPFFYQFEPGLPGSLRPLLGGVGAAALLGGAGLLIVQRRYEAPGVRYAPIYFAGLGVGFISIEIALIQQTRLFVGHPTLAITTVLATLLIGGGVGSRLAGGRPEQPHGDAVATRQKWLVGVIGAIVGLILLWLVAWPWLSQIFLARPTFVRIVMVVITLLPLALLMGIPFPCGLRILGQFPEGERHVALGWGVNGVMTVVGSVLAVTVALWSGFSSVLLVGVGAYGVAAACAYLSFSRP